MSQTYFTEEEYAKEFENVVANVTEGTRFWLVDKVYDYPKLGIMPNGIHGPVSTAAYRGFLYDKDGNQIWDLGKAVRNEEIGEEGYKKGEYYLHFGDQTYHIFNDPHESEYIQEGDKVSLKPITENLPEFKQTAPTRPRAPEKPQEVAKPQLNGFWSFIDKAVNFFTGGKRHLPSVEKYNDWLATKDKAMQRYEEAMILEDDYAKKFADQKHYESLQKSIAAKRAEMKRQQQKQMHRTKLKEAMVDYVKVLGNENTVACSNLLNAFTNMENQKLAPGVLDATCDTLARYFLNNGDPDKLLGKLTDCSAEKIETILKNAHQPSANKTSRDLSNMLADPNAKKTLMTDTFTI